MEKIKITKEEAEQLRRRFDLRRVIKTYDELNNEIYIIYSQCPFQEICEEGCSNKCPIWAGYGESCSDFIMHLLRLNNIDDNFEFYFSGEGVYWYKSDDKKARKQIKLLKRRTKKYFEIIEKR